MMMTAGVVIDSWKLEIFKRNLDGYGYKYTQHPGLTQGTLLLKVQTADLASLQTVIESAQQECKDARK